MVIMLQVFKNYDQVLRGIIYAYFYNRNDVEYRELSFLVRMNVDSAKKLIKHKYKGAII